MLRLILCDDDETVLTACKGKLERLGKKHGITLSVQCFASGEALLFAVGDAPWEIDLLYLDVQMNQLDGIETAKRLRQAGCTAQLIFLTNARDAVFESFDAAPLQYLIKGQCSAEKFETVFLQAVKRCKKQETECFLCERGGTKQAIPMKEIIYFEVIKRIVTVHYDHGTFDFYGSIEELAGRLQGKGFLRTHRAYLVQMARIRRLGRETLVLTDGDEIPLGRTYAKPVKEMLSQYLSSGGQFYQGDAG